MSTFYNIVTALQDISGIVTNESARLDQKERNIDSAASNQQRIIFLNQSYGQRMQQYTFIAIVLSVTFFLVAILLYLQKNFDIIPTAVYDIFIAILIGGTGLYCYSLYNNILSRDKLDFSKISQESPTVITPAQLAKDQAAAVASGQITGAVVSANSGLGTCVGPVCCPSSYDISNNRCGPVSAFTTLEQSQSEYQTAYTNLIIR